MYQPKKYSILVEVTALPFRWAPSKEITMGTIHDIRDALVKKLDRIDDFLRVWWKVMNDPDLPKQYWGIDDAYDRAYKLYRLVEEGIDETDAALEAWENLETHIDFIINEVCDAKEVKVCF